jgi:hypothetical protein
MQHAPPLPPSSSSPKQRADTAGVRAGDGGRSCRPPERSCLLRGLSLNYGVQIPFSPDSSAATMGSQPHPSRRTPMGDDHRMLPQLESRRFLTDSGLETTLIFIDGFELPQFAAFVLLETSDGRDRARLLRAPREYRARGRQRLHSRGTDLARQPRLGQKARIRQRWTGRHQPRCSHPPR